LQRIFAADSLQICCSQKQKTEDFRHEREKFSANLLQMQQERRDRRGFPRVRMASVPRLAAGFELLVPVGVDACGSA